MQEMKVYALRQYDRLGWGERLRLLAGKRRAFPEDMPLTRISMEIQLRRRKFNLGCKLGDGIMVVDFDGPDQGPFAGLESPMCCITSRGEHHYFRTDLEISNKIKADRRDVDLLFHGITVLPPSEHPTTGIIYRWKHGIIRPEDLPEFPQELVPNRPGISLHHPGGQLPDHRTIDIARRGLAKRYSIAGAGGDMNLFRAACYLVQYLRLPPDTALALLREWNASDHVRPPWDDDRLQYKISEAIRLMR